MKFITLCLALFTAVSLASPFVKPSEPHGLVVFNVNHSAHDIFPVSLYAIDGKQVITRQNAVWLSPGKHTLNVSSTINLTARSNVVTATQKRLNRKKNIIEIDVKEGKKYYVGMDASDNSSNKWRPVVWKVK